MNGYIGITIRTIFSWAYYTPAAIKMIMVKWMLALISD